MGEAWKRAPLLELGVTVVNPSSHRALAPARWSPTRDRSTVPSDLHRFQVGPLGNRPRLQIPPEGNEQFPRERHNPNVSQTWATAAKTLLIPLRQRTLGLVLQPEPRESKLN